MSLANERLQDLIKSLGRKLVAAERSNGIVSITVGELQDLLTAADRASRLETITVSAQVHPDSMGPRMPVSEFLDALVTPTLIRSLAGKLHEELRPTITIGRGRSCGETYWTIEGELTVLRNNYAPKDT